MFRLSAALVLLCATGVAGQVPAPAAPLPPVPAMPHAAAPVAPMAPPAFDRVVPFPRNYVDVAPYADDARSYANAARAYANDALATIDRAGISEQVNRAMRQVAIMPSLDFGDGGPVAWARQDPADSLYRSARDLLNRGDYRKAAELFKSLPQRFPTSVYVGDAEYWQAFSLYRIGGTPELQQALAVLEARKPDAPSPAASASDNSIEGNRQAARASAQEARASAQAAREAARVDSRASVNVYRGSEFAVAPGYSVSWGGSHVDAAGLAARIASVLSSRGLGADPAVKRALAAGGNACDPDDQSVRAEALNALMQSDPATGRQMAVKILANRDSCSVPLRSNAVMLVGNQHDEAAVTALLPVVRSDPSQRVRMEAMEFLVQNPSPAAKGAVRAIVDSSGTDESIRAMAIEGVAGERLTAEDATWLRSVYAHTASTRTKSEILEVLSQAGGDANAAWLAGIARDDAQPMQLRSEALELAGRNLDVAALGRLYDSAAERPIRSEIIALLGQRKEPAALDKIVDIAKNGTDPSMRSQAISVLANSKDPRASQLLLQLVDK